MSEDIETVPLLEKEVEKEVTSFSSSNNTRDDFGRKRISCLRFIYLMVTVVVCFGISVWYMEIDVERGSSTIEIGNNFYTSFATEPSEGYENGRSGCQETAGSYFCEPADQVVYGTEFESNMSGMALKANYGECSCKEDDMLAGHVETTKSYYYGKASARIRWDFNASNYTTTGLTWACFAGYSELRGQSSHNEINFCYVNEDPKSIHVAWFTGSWLHTIHATPGDWWQPTTKFHEYSFEWTDTYMQWKIDNITWYTRENYGCGWGPALDNLTLAKYDIYDWSQGKSIQSPFFDTGTNMTNCSFPYDEENKMTYPMQLRLLTRPSGSTRSNAEDYHIESDVLDLQFENYIKDESEFEKIKEKWDGFEYDCWTTVSAYSGTFHRKDCTYGIKLWLWIAYNFYPVTILLALLCLFGAIWARSLQILQFIFATLLKYTSHKALSIKKITRVKTWLSPQYWNTPTAASSWSSVGLIGLFTRQSKEQQKSKRRQIIWFSFFFSVVIFVGYFLGPNIWNRLSLKANFNNSDLTNTVVLTLVLMQVFHFIALAFTPYPGKCTWKNDASFVNMIGVVIPCHRSADEIGRTLESILKNGIKPEHIIVVDNAHSPVSPDDTQDRVQAYAGVQYIYLPIGHKSNALFTGIQALPTTVKYIMHIDDDTVLPSNMIFDPSHFNTSPAICAISYGISCFRHGTIECLVDFELALWSHWRLYRAQHAATAWFCHGIVGLWRRQCLEAAFAQHPFLPFGEDGWLGAIAMAHGWVIKQELRSSVLTFAPPRLLPPLLPKQIYERSLTAKSRVQGYGAASVWKQRSRRWFVNAPRRLFHILLLFLGYTSENASLCADFFFRVEIVRHVVITLVIIIYPLFILRVIYDGSWIDIIILKGVLFVLDIALYGGINYLLWYHRPELQVSLKTVLLYPFYRTFLRFAYVVAHWSCLLDYIPFYPMRTAQFFNTAPLDFTPNLQCFLVWCWQRAFFPPEPLDIDYVQVQSDKEQQLEQFYVLPSLHCTFF